MKCPQCSFHHRARRGMDCSGPGCNYKFTFNPKAWGSYEMTDGRFLAAARKASQNDTAYFTKNQLYAAYAARQTYSVAQVIVAGIIVSIFAGVLCCIDEGMLFVFVGGALMLLALLTMLFAAVFGKPKIMKHKKFIRMVNQWLRDGKRLKRLIERPSLQSPPPDWKESDIYDYGVERILIVQRDILVDLMVMNGVHSRERMLVISESGYPSYLMAIAARLLEESPVLPIFILHDADEAGMAMMERLKNMPLPIAGHPVTDLGMTPHDFKRLKRTKNYEPKRRARDLPVDAMTTPFLLTGLGACFATNVALGDLIDKHARESAIANASSHFG